MFCPKIFSDIFFSSKNVSTYLDFNQVSIKLYMHSIIGTNFHFFLTVKHSEKKLLIDYRTLEKFYPRFDSH